MPNPVNDYCNNILSKASTHNIHLMHLDPHSDCKLHVSTHISSKLNKIENQKWELLSKLFLFKWINHADTVKYTMKAFAIYVHVPESELHIL